MSIEYTQADFFAIQANNKFMMGDSIDDMELAALIDFYSDVVKKLEMLGQDWILLTQECRRRLLNLEDFQRARRTHMGP